MRFQDFPLAPDVLEAIDKLGFQSCTPIQARVIGPIIDGRDVVGKAETGTGKTLGFVAPMVGRLDTQRVAVQGIVLAPTRELAQQIAGVFVSLGAGRNLNVALVVGGVHASEQIEALRRGCQVVVGTPGRVLDLLRERLLSLAWCEVVVLDEADRMLDMGFIDDVTAILDVVPKERQTLLFSATVPPEVQKLLHRYMRDPEVHSTAKGLATVPEIAQYYLEAEFPRKFRELTRIFDENPEDTAIVFCNTRRQAVDLDRMLWGHGYSVGALHGDQEQDVRFRILEAFRKGDIRTLVATDVASRGLDIEAVTRVINYEVPDEPDGYVHRIGRTGRATNKGIAITLVARKESRKWRAIVDATGFPIDRMGPKRFDGAPGANRDERRERRSRGSRRGRSDRGGRAERGPGGEVQRAATSPAMDAGEEPRGPADFSAQDRGAPRRRRRRGGRRQRGSGSPNDALPRAPGPEGEAEVRTVQGSSFDRRPPRERDGARGPRESGGSAPPERPTRPHPADRGAPKQPKKKLSEFLEQDGVKTEYFDVNPELLPRGGPPPAVLSGRKDGPSGGKDGRRGRRSRSRGRGRAANPGNKGFGEGLQGGGGGGGGER